MTAATASSAPIEVFISYAHADDRFRGALEKHLSLLRRQEVISTWHDRKIGVGTEWADQIDEHLELFGFPRANLSMRPSDYFRRQCFVSVEEAEPGLDAMIAS